MRSTAPILAVLLAIVLPASGLNTQTARPAFQDHYADVNGVRLHYASIGQGPLVLFLHGYPSFCHPAATIPTSWSATEITKGARSTTIDIPTLVIWGMKDAAILSGHLSGLEKWVPNLSVRLYPDDDHWVMLARAVPVAQDIRRYIEDSKTFPRESVYRTR